MGTPKLRLVLSWACLTILLAAFCATASSGFVKREGSQLMVDGKPWYFIGANAYWLMDFAKYSDKRPTVDSFFKQAAKYGLNVIRIWGFNHNCPKAKGVYDEQEMQGFDYIIKAAGQNGIRLVMALGNTWSAYRSPEDFMRMAGIDPAGKTLLQWYQSDAVKAVYEDHIWNMVTRKNTYTGVAYRDDPTIMMWDVINEPRCPGCMEDWMQSAHQAWLKDVGTYLKNAVPNQLVAAGTEGYFMDSANVGWNPGAGAYCEGEDWVAVSQLAPIDVTIAHIYDRQMEAIPPTWRKAGFDDFVTFFVKYLDAHERAARNANKPLVIEEFNVILPTYTEAQRAAVFQVVYDYLRWQRSVGGALAGAMFWNAAIGSDVSDDGYNIYLDVPDTTPTTTTTTTSTSSGTQTTTDTGTQTTTTTTTTAPTVETSRAPIVANNEGLDDFRRGTQREQCAEKQASSWLPSWNQDWARNVDVSSYLSRTSGKRVQDVIKETAQALYS